MGELFLVLLDIFVAAVLHFAPETGEIVLLLVLGTAEIGFAVFVAISVWKAGRDLRGRIWNATGQGVSSEMKLCSLNTWLEVDKIERPTVPSQPIQCDPGYFDDPWG